MEATVPGVIIKANLSESWKVKSLFLQGCGHPAPELVQWVRPNFQSNIWFPKERSTRQVFKKALFVNELYKNLLKNIHNERFLPRTATAKILNFKSIPSFGGAFCENLKGSCTLCITI